MWKLMPLMLSLVSTQNLPTFEVCDRGCDSGVPVMHLDICNTSVSTRYRLEGSEKNANVTTPHQSQPKQYGQPSQQSKPPRQTQQPGTGVRCYTCGRTGHIARKCIAKSNSTAAMLREKVEQVRGLQEEIKELGAQCDATEYETDEPPEVEETGKPSAKPRKSISFCRQHNRAECPQCIYTYTPAHHCQALIVVCQDCGQHHPVVADACHTKDQLKPMPVVKGTVEGQTASVLRDTGCSAVIVRRPLVPYDKMTGQVETCILIDGTVRHTPVAEVQIETPFFSGTILAVYGTPNLRLNHSQHSGCCRPTTCFTAR